MTDRYERIREALAMGPTRGMRYARDQKVIGPYGVGVAWCGTNMTSGRDGSYSIDTTEACANASLAAACDPDTIRELLAERHQLAAALAEAQRGLRYAVRVWVLSDEIVWSEEEIDEAVERIIGDAKKEARND